MAKFEITNPEALKLIADFKSGLLFKPFIEKIRKIKWLLISICLFLAFLIFFNLGKALFQKADNPIFLPPSLDTIRETTTIRPNSEFDGLKDEIFNFSTDLPDPVLPDLNNQINLQKEEL